MTGESQSATEVGVEKAGKCALEMRVVWSVRIMMRISDPRHRDVLVTGEEIGLLALKKSQAYLFILYLRMGGIKKD